MTKITWPGFEPEEKMTAEKRKEFKAYEKALIGYPYWDGEELSDEHRYIFDWLWKRYADIREKAWRYDDLSH